MRGLNRIARRELTRRKARYALTALGIVLGVANIFGVLVTNTTTNHSLAERSSFFSAGADTYANRGGGDTLDEHTLSRLGRLPHVRTVNVFGQEVPLADSTNRSPIFLVPMDAAAVGQTLRPVMLRGRVFRIDVAEATLSRTAARRLHKTVGDTLLLKSPRAQNAQLRLRVTGIERDPPRSAGNIVYGSMSLEYLWRVTGSHAAETVNFYLDKGTNESTWLSDRESEFPDVTFGTTALPADFRRFLYVLQGAMSGAAAIAVFVGAFLIYLTFSMAVVERTRMYGTLHAVGSTSGQVARAVLRESLLLGAFATAAGLLLGAVLSLGLLRLVGSVVQVPIAGLVIPPVAVIAAVIIGVVATVVGSLLPARRAARVSPVEAIRGTQTATPRASRAWIAGVVLLAAGIGISVANRGIKAPNLLAQTATLAVLLGSVLCVPPVLGGLVRITRRFIRRVSGPLGEVAVMHLVRERSRSAYTLGLVMVVLAMMLALTATSGSVGRSVNTWVDKRFGADLLAFNAHISKKTQDAVAAVPGVRALTPVTFGQARMTSPETRSDNLVLIDPPGFFKIAGFPWADGTDDTARTALAAGGHVLLPAALAQQLHVKRGNHVTLITRGGPAPFEVAGIYAAFGAGSQIGIVAGFADAPRFFVGEGSNVLYINIDPHVSRHNEIQAIDAALVRTRPQSGSNFVADGPDGTKIRSGYFFQTGAQIKADARRNVRSYFSLFYAVLFVAVIVGLLGLANTMATSVIHRYRELGVLGAVGAGPDDVRRMVLAEAGVLVSVAFVLSLALGTLLARLLVGGVASLVGFQIDFVFPWRWIPVLGVLAAVIALTAAVAPARRAARLTPVEALRYE